ncbi:cellulase family glycosylhydrolase [bacterium]|nr:cellulase family glycosylhydrolase [bacterium]
MLEYKRAIFGLLSAGFFVFCLSWTLSCAQNIQKPHDLEERQGLPKRQNMPKRKALDERKDIDDQQGMVEGYALERQTDSQFIYGLRVDPPVERDMTDIEVYFKLARDLGMGYIKIGILWDYVEPEDDKWTWRGRGGLPRAKGKKGNEGNFDYDKVADLSKRYSLSVIPMFLTSKMRDRATNPDEFAEYVHAFIKRYHEGMNIRFVEFQNEPNAENDGRGGGKHWSGTAADLARVNTAAYEKVKPEYPDVMIGTAGFISGSRKMIERYTNRFYEAYFKAKPKFDVFMIHDYPKNISYTQGTMPGDLSSQYHTFETYRGLLDHYGYSDKPILISEGNEEKQDISDVDAAIQYVASFVMARSNADKNRVIGRIISNGLISNKKIALMNERTKDKTSQFTVLRNLIRSLNEYPVYSGRVAGDINSEGYWVEEFKNSVGKRMWIAFCPLLYETADGMTARDLRIRKKTHRFPQGVVMKTGDAESVRTIDSLSGKEAIKDTKGGELLFELGQTPVLIIEQ